MGDLIRWGVGLILHRGQDSAVLRMETGIFDRVVEVALQRCYLSLHQHTVRSSCAAAATHHRHKQGHAYHSVYVLWDWEASFYPHKSQKPITYNLVQSRDLAFFVFDVDSRVLTIIGLLGVCEKKKQLYMCLIFTSHGPSEKRNPLWPFNNVGTLKSHLKEWVLRKRSLL